MIRQKHFLISIVLAALVCCLASQAVAEILYARKGRANNVGFGLGAEWGGPLRTGTQESFGGTPFEYPTGSGNYFTNDVWLMSMTCVRDLDNDGSPEDTSRTNKNSMACYAGLNEERLANLAKQGLNMETATSNRAGTDISFVWSSLDPDNLASWPWEAREPKGPGGVPVIKGAETLVCHSSTAFNAWYNYPPPTGFYQCWSLYFINFGEHNDMIYGHVWMQNATHYFKYNDNLKDNYGATLPDGHKWYEVALADNLREQKFSGASTTYLGWAFHPAKEIVVHYCNSPTVPTFTPQEPWMLGWKMLRKPSFNGETMKLTNINCWDHMSPFGFEGAKDFMTAYNISVQHQGMLGKADLFPGQTNPFTGRTGVSGWPGMLEESDARFNQWLWGGDSQDTYTMFSALHDMEPRDSTSWDFVIMCVPAMGRTIVKPELIIENIDDPGMQEAFKPVEDYEEAAQDIFAGGLLSPETPQPPALTIIPGDREVTLTWSDINAKQPDNFYYYLEENGYNSQGFYQEYDLEGYRVYRSFVGPSDSHSELLADFNNTSGTLQFYYVDRQEDDTPFFRMQNGMKVWYAVVPYDKNYDPTTGEEFSLPAINSSKTWNRPGTLEYNVVPHSNASNFKAAAIDGVPTFVPVSGGEAVNMTSFELTGDGHGKLTQAPVFLAPDVQLQLTPVIHERITEPLTVYLECISGRSTADNEPYVLRNFMLREASSESGFETGDLIFRQRQGSNSKQYYISSPPHDEGVDYSVSIKFSQMTQGDYLTNLYMDLDPGGYDPGGPIGVDGYLSFDVQPGGTAPSNPSVSRSGVITAVWTDAGGGELTLDVTDVTRDRKLEFTPLIKEEGWGLIPVEDFHNRLRWTGTGPYYDEMYADEHTALMKDKLAADRTQEFAVYINGLMWTFRGLNKVLNSMPAVGTTFTFVHAYGQWNSDSTKFIQWPDPPFPDDKWEIKVKPTTMNPEDAQFSKITVVPNPYIGTSPLDLSPMSRRIEFVNLPVKCTVRIYSVGGNLVNVLNHVGANRQGWGNYTEWDRLTQSQPKEYTGYDNHSGTEPWNLRNRFGQTVASGLYFFHVTDERGKTYTGKFYVVL